MTSAFYRTLTTKYSQHTKWFPLSNSSLWTLLSSAGVCSFNWKSSLSPMEVLDLLTQQLPIDSWSATNNYCMVSFYNFMDFCLKRGIIVPHVVNVLGSTSVQPSIRLHMSWFTIFIKVYDI